MFIENPDSYCSVKTTEFGNQTEIHYESEVVHSFRQLIDDDPDLRWQVPSDHAYGRLQWVELHLDDRALRFKPLYLLKPSIPELETRLANWEADNPPLLVTPELLPRLLDLCRQKQLAAIDLNGRAYIRLIGVLVDRPALPGRKYRFRLEPRNVFVGKSVRIVRTLLTDRDRLWVQSELVDRTKASSGLVSRIVQYLISQGLIEKQTSRKFRLRDPLGLVDAWVKADDFNRRVTAAHYTAVGSDPLQIARQLRGWARRQSVSLAFTQWIAGWLRHPYTEPLITTAYVARLPEPAALERFGLRRVTDAGKVCLLFPDDEGVFLETQQVQGLSLVTDAQIYVDLQKTGLRGPDQAEALRNWQGFCRP